jgi:hypothetical protein
MAKRILADPPLHSQVIKVPAYRARLADALRTCFGGALSLHGSEKYLIFIRWPAVDGGENSRKSGDDQKSGTEFALHHRPLRPPMA